MKRKELTKTFIRVRVDDVKLQWVLMHTYLTRSIVSKYKMEERLLGSSS